MLVNLLSHHYSNYDGLIGSLRKKSEKIKVLKKYREHNTQIPMGSILSTGDITRL